MDNQAREAIETLRRTLLANGYSPIPNRDKRTFHKGWPNMEITDEVIGEWSRRSLRDSATGLRVENGLMVIDLDINDKAVVDEIANRILDICPQLDDPDAPLLVRHGKGAKEAWFLRTDELFSRIHTRTWVPAGANPDDAPTAFLEAFGGGSSRQFGSFGWHTRPEDDPAGDGILYQWEDLSPADVRLEDLPVVTKAQVFAIADAAEAVLQAHGWEPVARSTKGENDAVRIYDLNDDMEFDCNDDLTRSLDELRDFLKSDPDGELRCSAAWLEGPQAKRTDRCLVSLTRAGYVAIYETASAVTHVEAAGQPVDYGPQIDRIAEKLQELAERRRLKIKAADDFQTAVAKMLQLYAYCPTQQNDIVPLWSASPDEGKPVAKFRMEMLPNAMEEVGPRGGRRLLNPVDAFLRSERRLTTAGTRMRPDKPRPTFEENGRLYVNCYDPPLHLSEGGDAGTGMEFFEHLIPEPVERNWFLDWLSFKLQYPHIPGPAVVFVAHQTFGTGRGTLGVLLGKLFGEAYVQSVPFNTFTGKTYQSQYNEWLADSLIVTVNESSEDTDGSAFRTKRNTYEHLKEIVEIRPTTRLIFVKRERNFRAPSSTSFIISTNHADALPIPEHDRRFCVIQNGGTKPVEWWEAINLWLEDKANVAALYEALVARGFGAYSPFAPPPSFAGKRRMVEESKSDLDQAYEIALQDIKGKVFTATQVETGVRAAFHTHGLEHPGGQVGHIVKRILRRDMHRVGERHGHNWFLRIGDKREAIYARTASDAEAFTMADRATVERELRRNGVPSGDTVSTVVPFKRS